MGPPVSRQVFDGCEVILELGSIPTKEKGLIKKKVEERGGKIALSLSSKTSFVITTGEQWKNQAFKLRSAQKRMIPVVDVSYLDACIRKHKLLPSFLYAPQTPSDPIGSDPTSYEEEKIPFFTRTIQELPDAKPQPYKPSEQDTKFSIAKRDFLLKNSNKKHGNYCALELHVEKKILTLINEPDCSVEYRMFVHSGTTKELLLKDENSREKSVGKKEIYILASIGEAEALYSHFLEKFRKQSFRPFQLISPRIGSDLMPLSAFSGSSNVSILQEPIQQLVKTIYQESERRSNSLFDEVAAAATKPPLGKLSLPDIEKAESCLMQIFHSIQESKNSSSSQEEYNQILFQQSGKVYIQTLHDVVKHQQICQILKDRLCCNEGLDSGCLIDRQFAALSCDIHSLSQRHPVKYEELKQQVMQSARQSSNKTIEIREIYQIQRENESFADHVGTVKTMFHGTSPGNLLGLLSRGLLLPSNAEAAWYLQGARRDIGMLGAGIYFTDDANSAAQYCSPTDKKRFMFIADVALGSVFETKTFNTSLTSPPSGYDSVHGVKGSSFVDDEYVVYNKNQQTLRYLVEFGFVDEEVPEEISLCSVTKENKNLEDLLAHATEVFMEEDEQINESRDKAQRVQEQAIEKERELADIEPEVGLVSSKGASIPLKCTHIRANVLDLVGTVQIYQEYSNESNKSIEAKYVFPLDEKGAVCGFEAYINGKHVIGEVKEKEKAHKEYKEAIEQGHGAYLMDQHEKPDAWTVSVGNLPPQASVIIKITYVTELDVDRDDIIFRFPASLSGNAKKKAAQEITQTSLESQIIDVDTDLPQSFKLTFEMPYEILRMYSPTHSRHFNMKSTDTKGTIELLEQFSSLGKNDLEFRITLANAYQPRMWIEENEDGSHRAAMVCFYPKFEFSPQLDNEFLFLVDRSASMQGSGNLEANRVIQMLLRYLPKQSYFNIVAFGSTSDELFFLSQQNSPESIQQASEWLQRSVQSNLGTTDLYSILYRLYLRVHANRAPRHIILLSDGQIHHFSQVLDLVKQNSHHTRLFGCGVSSKCNRHSLYALSCAGRGSTEVFATKASMQFNDPQKVNRLYEKAVQPAISNVDINWVGDAENILQAPRSILSVFHGERKVIYGMLGKELCSQAILSSQGADGEMINTRVASHTATATRNANDMIHKLSTRALLRDYEEGSYSNDPIENSLIKAQKKQEMIDLSCQYNVVCSLTSFLAIEKRDGTTSKKTTPKIDNLLKDVPNDLISYIGWGEGMEQLPDKLSQYREQSQDQFTEDGELRASSTSDLSLSQSIDLLDITDTFSDVECDTDTQNEASLDLLLHNIQDSLNGIIVHTATLCEVEMKADYHELLNSIDYCIQPVQCMDLVAAEEYAMDEIDDISENYICEESSGRDIAVQGFADLDCFSPEPEPELCSLIVKESHSRSHLKKHEVVEDKKKKKKKKDGKFNRLKQQQDKAKQPEENRKLEIRRIRSNFDSADYSMDDDLNLAIALSLSEQEDTIEAKSQVSNQSWRQSSVQSKMEKKPKRRSRRAGVESEASSGNVEKQKLQTRKKFAQKEMKMVDRDDFIASKPAKSYGKQSTPSASLARYRAPSARACPSAPPPSLGGPPPPPGAPSCGMAPSYRGPGSFGNFANSSKKVSSSSSPATQDIGRAPLGSIDQHSYRRSSSISTRGGGGGGGGGRGRGGSAAFGFSSTQPQNTSSGESFGESPFMYQQQQQQQNLSQMAYMPCIEEEECSSDDECDLFDDDCGDFDECETVNPWSVTPNSQPEARRNEKLEEKKKKQPAPPMKAPRCSILYEKIISNQNNEGFWDLTSSLEQHAGFKTNELLEMLQSVGYQSIGKAKAKEAEQLFATAIVIEIFLQSEKWKNCSAIAKAIEWLQVLEKSEVSSCYQLGLSSNWRAFARHVLAARDYDHLEHSPLNPQVSITRSDLWIGF